jgi:hypothetical protein
MLNMLGMLQTQMRGKSQPDRQPQPPNYSEWTLRPEFRSDLGDRAQGLEQMLRMFGPMMLGGGKRNGLFYKFMSPPEAQPRQQFNPFSMMAFGMPPKQRNAFLDRFSGMQFNRR